MGITIYVDGKEYIPEEQADSPAVDIVMWYDRHLRHWELYPVDALGNQLAETQYAFGKKEATACRKRLIEEYIL